MAKLTKPGVAMQFYANVAYVALIEVPVAGTALAEAQENAKNIKLSDVRPDGLKVVDDSFRVESVCSSWWPEL